MTDDLNSVKTTSKPRASYHHGGLHEALITAAEAILRERGATGFSLREAARRAGVSPGAPAHHFGDSKGLLTAVAARGFERLTQELQIATAAAPRSDRLKALGVAYLNFARQNAALFGVMWLRELLDQTNADYLTAGRAAFNVLERVATGENMPIATAPHVPDPAVIAAWSMVHGLAKLTLDGALEGLPEEVQLKVLDLLPHGSKGVPIDLC
jgi:AcrR family transcriptional regulator